MAYCAGCRPRDRKYVPLKKRCALLLNHGVRFCYECSTFPCRNLERIDARYHKHYRTSWIEISPLSSSIRLPLLSSMRMRSGVARCGGVLCCHNAICFKCGIDRLRTKKQLHRWEDEQYVDSYLNNKPHIHADEPNSDQVRTIWVRHSVAHIWATNWLPRCKPSADLHMSQRISMIRIINMLNILISKGGEEEDA